MNEILWMRGQQMCPPYIIIKKHIVNRKLRGQHTRVPLAAMAISPFMSLL